MVKKIKLFFFLIFLIAVFSRFYKLSSFPPALNWDEVSHGYNAYNLLKTGKDQWGAPWPTFNFRAYGDYPMALNLYLTLPSISIFGLNSFAVRLPSALAGIIIIIASYYLGKMIFSESIYGLLLMFTTALSPWTILTSRAVFQSTIAQAFFLVGVVFFLYSVKEKKPGFFLPATIFWSLSEYGYHNTRLMAPALLIFAIFIYKGKITPFLKKRNLLLIIGLLLFSTLTAIQLIDFLNPSSRARGKWVFIIDQGAINTINEQRRTFSGNKFAGRLIYNKVTYFVPRFLSNFSQYFSPRQLFYEGGKQYQFSVQGWGLLYPVWIIFFYLGLISIFLKVLKKKTDYLFILIWWVIGLIPAAITKDGFQVLRSMMIIPLPQLAIVEGLKITWLTFSKSKTGRTITKLVYLVIILLSVTSFSLYLRDFFGPYSKSYSWAWQYGYEQVVDYLKQHYSQYNKIIFSKRYGEPHEFILFYWPWPPDEYQKDTQKVWDYHADWYWVDRFDKFVFVNDWEVIDRVKDLPVGKAGQEGGRAGGEKDLLVTSPGNYPEGWSKIKTINFLDGKPAFEILEK